MLRSTLQAVAGIPCRVLSRRVYLAQRVRNVLANAPAVFCGLRTGAFRFKPGYRG